MWSPRAPLRELTERPILAAVDDEGQALGIRRESHLATGRVFDLPAVFELHAAGLRRRNRRLHVFDREHHARPAADVLGGFVQSESLATWKCPLRHDVR